MSPTLEGQAAMTTTRSSSKSHALIWKGNMVRLKLEGGCLHFTNGHCKFSLSCWHFFRQYLEKVFKSQKGRPHPQSCICIGSYVQHHMSCTVFQRCAFSRAQFKKDESMRLYKIFKERELKRFCLRLQGEYRSVNAHIFWMLQQLMAFPPLIIL